MEQESTKDLVNGQPADNKTFHIKGSKIVRVESKQGLKNNTLNKAKRTLC